MRFAPFLIFLLPFYSYSQRGLTWANFKEKAPNDELTVAARSYTALGYASEDSEGMHKSRVFAQFLSNLSWVRIKSSEVLAHENCHWQICLLQAALCNKDLKCFQGRRSESSRPEHDIYQFYQHEVDRLNEAFDKETDHGLNKETEEKWEKSIALQLKQLQ